MSLLDRVQDFRERLDEAHSALFPPPSRRLLRQEGLELLELADLEQDQPLSPQILLLLRRLGSCRQDVMDRLALLALENEPTAEDIVLLARLMVRCFEPKTSLHMTESQYRRLRQILEDAPPNLKIDALLQSHPALRDLRSPSR